MVELYFLWEISKALNGFTSPQGMVESLNTVFQMFLDINKVRIFLYDKNTDAMREFSKNWHLIRDKEQNKGFKKIYDIFSTMFEQCFILNSELISFDINRKQAINNVKRILVDKNNSLYLPVVQNKKVIGIIEIDFDNITEELITADFFMTLGISASQISSAIINTKLNEQMEVNANFHNAMKEIAKIIESQYELAYIIPLIGEMLDKFITEHLIYIFYKEDKDEDEFKLLWPANYNKDRLQPILSQLKEEKA